MGTHVTTAENFVDSPSKSFPPNREAYLSGVSWGAVFGGAFATSALYLILLALGAGFDLSAVSPWSNTGMAVSAVSAMTIVWLIVIEIISSAFGGYLTGRLRTKWTLIHTDEVFFRDTANGFLSWCVALTVSVAFLASTAAWMAGTATESRTPPRGEAETALADPYMYFVDTLFRTDHAVPNAGEALVKTEASRILAQGLMRSEMAPADQAYLAQLVSTTTGLDSAAAAQRVSQVVNQARQAEDTARKATAHFLLWLFLSLLMGAFSASYAATIGGRQRDHVKAV